MDHTVGDLKSSRVNAFGHRNHDKDGCLRQAPRQARDITLCQVVQVNRSVVKQARASETVQKSNSWLRKALHGEECSCSGGAERCAFNTVKLELMHVNDCHILH